MGDTEPGSSTAAQSALLDPLPSSSLSTSDTHETSATGAKPSVLSRLKSVFTTTPPKETVAPSALVPEAPAREERPGMLNLRRMRVDDVAVPKADMTAVPHDITQDDLVKVFRESGNTRLPVYKGTLDTPIGLVHLKDFALTHGFNGTGGRFVLSKMLRPLIFAPPSMPIGVLLNKMQSDRMHMALVIDEYGGVDGLVTLEDLVEQVLGEIEDEHDIEEDVLWTKVDAGVYIAQAKAPLDDFENVIGLRLALENEDEESDTLGGLIFQLAGRVPVRAEVIPHPSGAEFEIIEADPRRIKRVRVRMPQAARDLNAKTSATSAAAVATDAVS